jgi:aspartyl/glutamyl-tRNA(Asn/Gln) amidotransferase C subunit
MLPKETIDHISKLARIKLTAEETLNISQQLSNLLDHFKKIEKLPTDNVEPLVNLSEFNIEDFQEKLRPDVVEKNVSTEEIIACSEYKTGHLFTVPPVI